MAFSIEGVSYPIRGTDTDWADRLQLSALFSLMQESALSNAETCGWGPDVLDPLGVRWVLLRVSVRMEVFPTWRDLLYVEPWPRGLDRLLFLRDFSFWLPGKDGNRGNRIGGATSSWVLVDMHTRKLRRPDIVPADPDRVRPDLCALASNAPPLTTPSGLCDGEPVIIKYADACDIDRNLHVNNTFVAWSWMRSIGSRMIVRG
jgi:acyl-ACP thioesterase